MQTGTGGFTDGVKAINVSPPSIVRNYAATGIVSCGNNRNRVFRDINTQLQAAIIDSREVLADKLSGLMRDIQKQAIGAQAFHFMVDSACDDIPGSQLGPFIEFIHKTLTVWQQ